MFSYCREKLQFDLFVSLKVNRHCHYTKKTNSHLFELKQTVNFYQIISFLVSGKSRTQLTVSFQESFIKALDSRYFSVDIES